MFLANRIYTHRNFLDVVMHVVRVEYAGPERIKLKVRWFNTRGMYLGDDRVTVKREHLPNWREWGVRNKEWEKMPEPGTWR